MGFVGISKYPNILATLLYFSLLFIEYLILWDAGVYNKLFI